MSVHFVVIPFEFNTKQFQRDLDEQRKRAHLTHKDLGAFVGRSSSWAYTLIHGNGIETVTLGDFVKLCNLFDLSPITYFQLSE